MNRAMVAHCA
jgi:hypothetical protein